MSVKTQEEIQILREGGRKLAVVLDALKRELSDGVSAEDLDRLAEKLIREAGGEPSFKGYQGAKDKYPYSATVCFSINDEVVHGLPDGKKIKDGDIIGLDIGMKYKNLFTDMAQTIGIGKIDESGERLIRVTKETLDFAISKVRPGIKTGDLGEAIQNFVAFADVLKRIHIRMASVENAIVDEPKRSVGNFPGVCDNVGVNNRKLIKR